jgi:hypothetical protein
MRELFTAGNICGGILKSQQEVCSGGRIPIGGSTLKFMLKKQDVGLESSANGDKKTMRKTIEFTYPFLINKQPFFCKLDRHFNVNSDTLYYIRK